MKELIKNTLAKAIIKTYKQSNFSELIEVQSVTAKNVEADFFSNISMKLAKKLKNNPMSIADDIVKNIPETNDIKISIVQPGYINFLIMDKKKNDIITTINNCDDLLSECRTKNKKKINIEFVSANPTGPLHVGHGRGVIYGNIIAKFLKIQGHDVTKEYYVNDFGNQIKKLCLSVFSQIDQRYSENEDDLYQGDYIKELADLVYKNNLELPTIDGNIKNMTADEEDGYTPKSTRKFIVDTMIDRIKSQLNKLDISFDSWFYESWLLTNPSLENYEELKSYHPRKIIEKLQESGYIHNDKSGAVMLKAEEPRVLIKSDATYTYFATDLAYHDLKLNKFDEVINIWGADHHGYIPRMKIGLEALGHNTKKLDIHLIQFANLFRDGEKISMSTRKGEYVELNELSDEIGKDAVNFFYLTKNKDQHLDFDLDIAINQNKNNPVYYIQYAQARIEKILMQVKNYKEQEYKPESLNHRLEKELVITLINFNEILSKTIIDLQPHLMTHYLQKISQDFHSYYANVKILNDDQQDYSKIHLIAAVQKVIRCGLDLLNINSPKVM